MASDSSPIQFAPSIFLPRSIRTFPSWTVYEARQGWLLWQRACQASLDIIFSFCRILYRSDAARYLYATVESLYFFYSPPPFLLIFPAIRNELSLLNFASLRIRRRLRVVLRGRLNNIYFSLRYVLSRR